MYYNTISEAKKAYKEAYNWGIRVQRACLLKRVDVTVVSGYCNANYSENDLAAFCVTVRIWDYEKGKHITAEWVAWNDPQKFEVAKVAVLKYLAGKGVVIK